MTTQITQLTIRKPDDWHVHLRDGDALRAVLPDTAKRFARAIVMPNLRPPVVTVADAQRYRERILAALPKGAKFEPLMTLYLTDDSRPEEFRRAKESGFIHGVKYYPAGATTNSEFGVTDMAPCQHALGALEELDLPLLIHGEVTNPSVDIFDREKTFIEQTLTPIVQTFPRLRVVLEHITTRAAVEFVKRAPANVAATITAHHLLLNRNAMFAGGIRPHHYCLPVLKREEDRQALIAAATSGDPKFFLGTDSAPHARHTKEADCGCAGIYTAHAGIELYAEAFAVAKALDKLENFASVFGARFYGLPLNEERIALAQESWNVPANVPFGKDALVPFRNGSTIAWRLQ